MHSPHKYQVNYAGKPYYLSLFLCLYFQTCYFSQTTHIFLRLLPLTGNLTCIFCYDAWHQGRKLCSSKENHLSGMLGNDFSTRNAPKKCFVYNSKIFSMNKAHKQMKRQNSEDTLT